jgi:hypothetical protein
MIEFMTGMLAERWISKMAGK